MNFTTTYFYLTAEQAAKVDLLEPGEPCAGWYYQHESKDGNSPCYGPFKSGAEASVAAQLDREECLRAEARAVLAECFAADSGMEPEHQDDLATLTIEGYPDKFCDDRASEQSEWVNDCLHMGKRYDPDYDKPIIQRGPEAEFPAGLIRSPDEVKSCVKCGCELKRGRDNMHLKAAPGGWLPYCFPCAE